MQQSTPEDTVLERLLRMYPDTPKTRAKQWILAGRVSVNGVVARKPQALVPDPNSTVELLGRQSTTLDCGKGWQIHPRVELLYLDSALAVVNKGAGLISVDAPNAPLTAMSILTDFLAGRLKARDRSVAARSLPPAYRKLVPLPVHRLDQYTTGVFCMAMNPEARQRLIEQLRTHSMRRQYVAFVEGRPASPKGTWRNRLQLSGDGIFQHVVAGERVYPGQDEPREAVTHYETIREYVVAGGKGVITKLRLRLETGLKHQIRIQAAHAGVPLVGDRAYNLNYRGPNQAGALVLFARQALHAENLALEHPDKPGTRLEWTAPLPKDLRELEASLR